GDLPYKIMVNVGGPAEIGDELFEKCDGIGLFRTEYLYLGRKDLPGEEVQLSVYRSILEKAGGKPVTVRSFDIGSDKNVEALPLESEDNPALGTRGLRVYTVYPEVFKTQIRALLRAAVYGDLRIMFPMVNSCGDIDKINETISLAARELSDGNIPYRIPLRGAMIETPAAALSADLIAGKVDFLSIGTNDLAQYTYAVDRQNGRLEHFCDPGYEAVMTLIRMTADAARRHGITSGICGELASDKKFSGVWAEIGIDYISVSPSALY
ncbi:MAG: phosphoenolpyruvate--protein phosphotransferase, partial [Firmicutes bacterium]|nr:phosphoenolpyruvate--protein phosphotransferase [Candidatus Colimorpha enterica]